MNRLFPSSLAILALVVSSGCGGGAETVPLAEEEQTEPSQPDIDDARAEAAKEAAEEEEGKPTPLFLRKPAVKLLSPEEQKAVLERRTTGAISGVFSEYADLLYGISDVLIAAEAPEILAAKLQPVFADDYRPTFRELFEVIGRQTLSSWAYSAERKAWFFAKPAPPLPFSMPAAEGWKVEDRGLTVMYKAPNLPVGLEVYVFGEYSAETAEAAAVLARKARDACALNFGRLMKKDVRLEDMRTNTVSGAEALCFECPTPRPGHTWRQWVVATAANRVFALVSVIPQEREKELLPSIQAMVSNFVSPPPVPPPQMDATQRD